MPICVAFLASSSPSELNSLSKLLQSLCQRLQEQLFFPCGRPGSRSRRVGVQVVVIVVVIVVVVVIIVVIYVVVDVEDNVEDDEEEVEHAEDGLAPVSRENLLRKVDAMRSCESRGFVNATTLNITNT
jgi:hypothetical protein